MTAYALTDEQIAEVKAPSTRYEPSAYKERLTELLKAKQATGRLETEFPGVKPQHVAHMLKKLMPKNAPKATRVTIDDQHGVCITF